MGSYLLVPLFLIKEFLKFHSKIDFCKYTLEDHRESESRGMSSQFGTNYYEDYALLD